jgi:hypothetical protein
MTRTGNVVALAVGLAVTSAGMAMASPQRPSRANADYRYHLTGTYQLESNRGDDPQLAARRASRAAPAEGRQRAYQSLLARLQAPERIAIERWENSVTMESTRGQRVTIEADGQNYEERWSAERTMNTRATLEGERLVVTTTGHRGSDFTVTFDPMANGDTLQMTRTIDDERLPRPVTVRNSYRRVSNDAQWSVETSARPVPDNYPSEPAGDFAVPDGTRFVAVLDDPLSTTNARDGDRYTLTARSPSPYEGAVIQGFVSTMNESRRSPSRAGLTLNLQSIRLRNGNSYPFDGVIEDVRTPEGEPVSVDRGGTVDTNDSQTQKTVERSVVGAALGALIGAVVGGGKGAAIGAAIGASGGAGTVIIEGRDQLDLRRGTELTITSGDQRRRR